MATLDDLISNWEPRMQRAFLDSIYNIRDQAQLDQIAAMVKAGDIEGVIRAVNFDPAQFRPLDKAIANAFEAGGELTAASIPPAISDTGFRAVFNFAVRNPLAESFVRNYSSNLVTEIIDDQKTAIRQYLEDGLSKGLNPTNTALDLVGRISRDTGKREGGIIGLTSSQEQWVRNYRDELQSATPSDALSRLLRDKRFDRSVLKAEREGKPLDADLIDKMVTTYKNRALRYRAETIARKETITALHSAQDHSMKQAIAAGNIAADQVTYIWRTAHDDRVRESHMAMNGQRRPLGTPFTSGRGVQLMYPGDPAAPGSETINCRCWREPKVDFLARIK